jgi:hypothetical protein
MFREPGKKPNIAVRKRADDEALLEAAKTGNAVGPRIEPVPDRSQMMQLAFGETLDLELVKQLKQALAMQHIKYDERTPPGAHLFHGWLIFSAPAIGKCDPVAVEPFGLAEAGHFTDDAISPINDGSEDVKEHYFDAL